MPALKLFERVAHDVAATHDLLAAQMDTRIADAVALAKRARHDVARLLDRGSRVEADYLAGEITGATCERLSARLDDDRAAAEAQAVQYEAHATEQVAARDRLDAEGEMLRRLAELREAIAGRIRGAEHDFGALRAA